MKSGIRTVFVRVWPAVLLELILYMLGDRMRISELGISLSIVLGFAPTCIAAYRMAEGPRYVLTAMRAGTLFWIAMCLFWAFAAELRPSAEIPLHSMIGYLLVIAMFLPGAVLISLLAGVTARLTIGRTSRNL